MKNEKLLCVHSSYAEKYINNDELITNIDFIKILSTWKPSLISRDEAEKNQRYRQLVTYTLLTYHDEVVTYSRNRKSGEARLHSMISVGFGGNVSYRDLSNYGNVVDLKKTIKNSINREMSEEVCLGRVKMKTSLGMIITNKTEVDRLHLGLIYRWELCDRTFKIIDETISDGRLAKISDVFSLGAEVESWSLISLSCLMKVNKVYE